MTAPPEFMRVVLSVQDEAGKSHNILTDEFGTMALNDIIGRLSLLEAFVAELVNRDAVVGKDLKEKARTFVKATA